MRWHLSWKGECQERDLYRNGVCTKAITFLTEFHERLPGTSHQRFFTFSFHSLLSRCVSTFSLSYCIRSPTLSFEVPYLETSKDIRGTNLFSFSKRQEYPNRKSAIFYLFRLHQRNIKGDIASAQVKVHSKGQETHICFTNEETRQMPSSEHITMYCLHASPLPAKKTPVSLLFIRWTWNKKHLKALKLLYMTVPILIPIYITVGHRNANVSCILNDFSNTPSHPVVRKLTGHRGDCFFWSDFFFKW